MVFDLKGFLSSLDRVFEENNAARSPPAWVRRAIPQPGDRVRIAVEDPVGPMAGSGQHPEMRSGGCGTVVWGGVADNCSPGRCSGR